MAYVEATPEEKVRQKWLSHMIGVLGYPKGLLAVEKQIATGRRFDILCYRPGTLSPLLLIEFKAESSFGAKAQAFGYNAILQAPFISVIQGETVATFWETPQGLRFVSFLPAYQELLKYV